MKLFISFVLLSSLLVSTTLQAEPRDGDTIEFVGYRGDDPSKLTLLEIASISDFDYVKKECTFRSVTYENGAVLSENVQTLKFEDIFSEEKGIEYVKKCEQHKGVRETLTTPAGTFETCLVKMDSLGGGQSLFNISPTPMATAKYVAQEPTGEKITMTLVRIVRGE